MSLDNVNHDEAVRFGNEVLRANRRRKILYRILSITMPFILLLFWELLARLGWIDTRFFAMPTQIAIVFWKLIENGQLLNDVTISLSRLLIGFALGGIPGLIVGILLGQSSVIRALLYPIIAAIYPIPKIAVLPLLLFIFGLGEASKYAIIAIGVFFILAVNTMTGAMNVPAIYLEVGKEFGASRLTIFRTVVIPAALPVIFAGIKLAWGSALLLIVSAEFVGAKSGIGHLIWSSWQVFSVEQMYVGLIVIAILGFITLLLLDELEAKLLPWRKHV
ncbi:MULTISPECIES: ABC transporter permease [Paenibacillus]|uniref:ABC transporter permease n=1 Tax=Paenibacillus naphthalenovorans TaxID=162209 RepID=A0A0U2L4R7_9BACL|nr:MULTISPECIES: ABC transporter permease [Paenibacillus]ALS24994.1 ABC transporter permease [Paenibacillus naphthalenovorans]GCL74076.1 ABC transporter permease [Paenibacillus naphthalenovorans]SDJ33840.1 NitT/TauT family transport system permease protein [Paenibacillus naphthalenovorans]